MTESRLEEDYIELIDDIFKACEVDDLSSGRDIVKLAQVAVIQDDAIDQVIALIDAFRAKN